MSQTNKEELVERAKLADLAERYDDMVSAIKPIVETGIELSIEERNLLSIAYKSVVDAKRASWRTLSFTEQTVARSEFKRQIAKSYKETVERELCESCRDILGLLDTYLIPSANIPESKLFYLKMKGDYYRYLAEVDAKKSIVDASLKAYQEALEISKAKVAPTHPIRLGIALNFSVFYFEILNSPAQACQLAREAFDDAIAELDNLDADSYEDCTILLQFLRDNLALWTNTMPDADEPQNENNS